MLVVDASVAVKWFYPELDSDKAGSILCSGKKLIAPGIIRVEVAAALTRLLRMKHLDAAMATTLLADWRQSLEKQTIYLESTLQDFDRATEISVKIGHQLQDCLYVAVAERLTVPLITADKKLLEKADQVNCVLEALHEVNT